jgi:nucleoid-associated protein YgaU
VTREHKLSLILGFCAIVFVGLLVSDHFSKARSNRVEAELATRTPPPASVVRDTPGIGPVEEPMVPAVAETKPTLTAVAQREVHEVEMGATRPITQYADGTSANNPSAAAGGGTVPAATTTTTRPANLPEFIHVAPGPVNRTNVPAATDTTTVNNTPGTTPATTGLPISKGKEDKYPVQRGDTMYKLAQKFYNDGNLAGALKDYNKKRLKADGTMNIGVTLLIPPKDVLLGQAKLADGAQTTRIAGGNSNTPELPINATPPVRNDGAPAPAAGTYTVKAGDNLGTIAQKTLGSSKRWKEILSANKGTLSSPEELKVGMVLKLPKK